jgi:L-histidine Nalpha-methyltransferase
VIRVTLDSGSLDTRSNTPKGYVLMVQAKPLFIQLHRDDAAALRAELSAGLACERAAVSPKFLYDALGSRLFDAITELPEYYPTRTERLIFERHGSDMAKWLGTGHTLVDLGAGSCEKASALFPVLEPRRYVAVDISVDYLHAVIHRLQQRHPALPMVGVGVDFAERLTLPEETGTGSRLFFYPGSSIGNFSPQGAEAFLRQCREADRGGGLLLGVDLVKDKATLEAAYDDPLQVTAAFNRNLLRRINEVLGSDAHLDDWRHVAFFDAQASRIEMHLEALRPVGLTWPGGTRRFAQGERIHTENSYKYTVPGMTQLLHGAGYREVQAWTDPLGWFAVVAARA